MKRLILLLGLLAPALGLAQPFSINAYKIPGGGGTSTGGLYTVSGTIGQLDTGKLSGGNYTLDGGFWSLIAVIQTSGAPALSLVRSGSNVILSWPAADAGFGLEETTSLGAPINWQVVSQTPVASSGTNTVTALILPGNKFYRLKKP